MTNGEKIQTILDVDKDCTEVHGENGTMTFTVTQDFWNAEYIEPSTKINQDLTKNKSEMPTSSTTKNDLAVDCIDRAELLKAMDTWDKFGYTETGCFVREPKGDYVPFVHYEDVVNCVMGMPPITPQLSSGTRKNSQKLEKDCISRTKAIEEADKLTLETGYDNEKVEEMLRELPPVTPIRPKGHWIWCVGSHKCSNCEEYTCFSHKELLRYCPNCGADMREVEEWKK